MSVFVTGVSLMLVIAGASMVWRAGERRRSLMVLGFVVLLAGATVARAPAVDDRLPYLSYVDEGHVLHPAQGMIAERTWDPGWYRYPSLTMGLTVAGTAAYSVLPGDQPIERDLHGGPSDYYDLGLAPAVIATGRIVVLLMSVLTVGLVGITALRLGGPSAAATAAAVAAVLPALVLRSATVNVHAPAAFFVSLCGAAVAYLVTSGRSRGSAAIAGAAAGMAFTSMYVAGAVLALALVAVAALDGTWRRRATLLSITMGSWAAGALITMPAFLFRWSDVWDDIGEQAEIYATRVSPTSFSDVLWRFDEVGWPYVLLAIGGLVILASRSDARRFSLGAGVFLAMFLGYLGSFDYQPLQTLVPLYPVILVLAAVTLSSLGARVRESRGRLVGASLVALVLAPLLLVGSVQGVYPNVQDPPEDSRTRTVRWLHRNVAEGRVLVAEELAFLPSQLAQLPHMISVAPQENIPRIAGDTETRYVVVPGRPVNGGIGNDLPPGFEKVSEFGRKKTPQAREFWRGNEQTIYVLRRDGQ